MKIMRSESWLQGFAAAARAATMGHGIRRSLQAPPGACALERRPRMTWQTPTATDLRFGFEITLYVAAR